MKPELTQARLKELLHYDPETGHFTWRIGSLAGRVAGHKTKVGYIYIRVDRGLYLAHRLAFLYVLGVVSDGDIDHANRIKDDNRWGNLRAASRGQNNANAPTPKHNTSGFKGVSWCKRKNKWRATVGKSHVGYFSDASAAAGAAHTERLRRYGIFAAA